MTVDADVAPPLDAGVVLIPGYTVLQHLSRAQELDAYEVWSDERRCRCVVKVLRPDRRDEERPRAHLLNEGHILERLSHPHIVRAYATVSEPLAAVVLEALTGATLSYLIGAGPRRLPAVDLAVLGVQLCSAIAYIHGEGLVHIDLKPSNVVADGGIAKLLDFSLARPAGQAVHGAGTRAYMAPEQAGDDVVGPPADVWGIGATLYEAATAELPFEGIGEDERYPQLRHRAPSVSRRRRLPRGLAAAIDACLRPDPAQRPTVDELADDLGGYL